MAWSAEVAEPEVEAEVPLEALEPRRGIARGVEVEVRIEAAEAQ